MIVWIVISKTRKESQDDDDEKVFVMIEELEEPFSFVERLNDKRSIIITHCTF